VAPSHGPPGISPDAATSRVAGREVLGVFLRIGWVVVAQTGTHAQLAHPNRSGRTTIPPHPDETIDRLWTKQLSIRRGYVTTSSKLHSEKMIARRTFTIVVELEETGGCLVIVSALPGCFTNAPTVEYCEVRAMEAIKVHLAGLRADGEPIPEEVGEPQLLAVTVAA
jgi:predicted RNA binding protein YcfA (HicA-like mRNA interferase family)/predicted RNase H-like HicB family nuclease